MWFEAWQPIRRRFRSVCTSALTILSTMVSRVSCRLHFITPSKYCERCFSASVTLVSRLLYVFSAARFCTQSRTQSDAVYDLHAVQWNLDFITKIPKSLSPSSRVAGQDVHEIKYANERKHLLWHQIWNKYPRLFLHEKSKKTVSDNKTITETKSEI